MTRLLFWLCLVFANPAFGSTWDPGTDPEDVILTEGERLKRQIERLKSCSGTLEDATNRMATIQATWIAGGDSKADLRRNFDLLVDQHRIFFKQVQTYLRRYENSPRNFEALEALLLEIERGHGKMLREQHELLKRDDLFLASIPPLEQGLREVATEYAAALVVCDSSLHDAIRESLEVIDELRRAIGLMAAYVAESGTKRAMYFAAKLREKRMQLIKRYTEATGRELEDVRSRIQVTLEADALHRRAQEWWHVAAVRQGVAKGLGTRELRHLRRLDSSRLISRESTSLRETFTG